MRRSGQGRFSPTACAVLSDAPLDLGKLREILQSHGGVMRLREEDWNAGVFAAFRQLSPDRQGGYFVYKLIELLYLLCGRGETELPPGCYYDPYQVEGGAEGTGVYGRPFGRAADNRRADP